MSVVSPINAYVFTEYVRPKLQFVIGPGSKSKPLVRAAYGSCLASLAHVSLKILEMVQALRADGSIPTNDPEAENSADLDATYQNLFDAARRDLVDHFESHTKTLLTDSDASVRRAFLSSVSSLCVFFGSSKASDVVLSHLNTYLNDKDWLLKHAFFQAIVGVATFIGGTALDDFMLPLMIPALTDPEECVVQRVLSSFASMAELGLFQRSRTWELTDIVARFTMHPNKWIKEAATHFVSSSTRYISVADVQCIVCPLLQPYLKTPVFDLAEPTLLDSLKKPLPRPVLDLAVTWAATSTNSVFWKNVNQQKTFSFGTSELAVPTISSKDLRPNALAKAPKNDDDENWLKRLRSLGMEPDDDFKLLALKEFIWRVASKRPKDSPNTSTFNLNGIMRLKEINVMPQTIFFEPHSKSDGSRRTSHEGRGANRRKTLTEPHTIADALLDASTTDNDPLAYRKRSYANARKDRLHANSNEEPGGKTRRRDLADEASLLSTSPSNLQESKDVLKNDPLDVIHGTPDTFAADTSIKASGNGTVTPTDSLKSGKGLDVHEGVRRKTSAINLLNRRDNSKARAETSTSAANAHGKVDGSFSRDPSPGLVASNTNERNEEPASNNRVLVGHTYDGSDPTVLKLLDTLAIENYSVDIHDFGPLIAPISRRHLGQKSDSQEVDRPWRPEGVLVTTFGEHTAPINRILPSPDHKFFISGSDDGTVKVWDTLRLERNIAHRSRRTHKHADGAQVKCLAFVENTHAFISCATDGSVQAVKVSCSQVGESSSYGRLRRVRNYHLPDGEYAVWVEHLKEDSRSILFLATNLSKVIAIDLRDMSELFTLENPIQHGTPTCFCVDKKHGWLLLGTSYGILDLWDLRFRLRLKAWGLSGGKPIHRLQIHPLKGRGRWVCVAGGTGQTDVTIWDLEKAECREVFRAGVAKGSTKEFLKTYEAWKVDDDKPEEMLSRFASTAEPQGSDLTDAPDRAIFALAMGSDAPEDGRDSKYAFFLTGGPDKKLRFWDMTKPDASMVVSGLQPDEDQPRFSTTHAMAALQINSEKTPAPSSPNAGAGGGKAGGKRERVRRPRSSVIALQQQRLLRNHLDTITDVAVVERPVGMTVSADRAGVIYVFQ